MNRLTLFVALMLGVTACLPDKKKADVATPPSGTASPAATTAAPAAEPVVTSKFHVAPELIEIPEGPFGDSVRRGAEIFKNTPKNAAQYSGNSQSCQNCHIDGGRIGDAGPMWAAWGMYPAYRKKNNRINTMEERLQGCFTFSQNAQASPHGAAPPAGDPVLVDLQSYIYWLSTGVPTGKAMPGRGFPESPKPAQGYSAERGKEVYAQNCAVCHGDDGQGIRLEDGTVQFPPLWGPEAYNWGAGMHRVNTAAAFIKANMPFGKPDLTEQQAWDVAAFINSQPRPKDPRQTGTIAENDTNYHDEECLYGEDHEGRTLGTGVARAR